MYIYMCVCECCCVPVKTVSVGVALFACVHAIRYVDCTFAGSIVIVVCGLVWLAIPYFLPTVIIAPCAIIAMGRK